MMVMLVWLLDFKKVICQNDPASQLSNLVDPYLIELSVFIGISDSPSQHYRNALGSNKL